MDELYPLAFNIIQEEKYMNTKYGLKVALYARFSSDLQRSESIDAQIRAMTNYCEQNHMQIIDTYIDEAKSATVDKRPSFQRMIKDSNKHIFDAVLVHKLDRFSRNRYDSAMYKQMLKLNGVRVFSVLENLDDTPESIMLESLLEGMSEYYSKNLAREVMKGLKENALQCKHTGGLPPLGYYVNSEKKLSIDEKEVDTVKLIFDRYANGYSYDEILSELRSKNLYTKKGNYFGKNSLYNILTNEKYTGTYVFNKSSSRDMFNRRNTHKYKDDESIIKVPNGCPQIIDTDTFNAVQKRIEENKKTGGQYNTKHRYLFSGLVICGYCGKRMVGNRRYAGRNKSLITGYRCNAPSGLCINKEINRYYLEDFVFAKVKEYFGYKTQVTKIYQKVNCYIKKNRKSLQDDIMKLTSDLVTVNQSLSNLSKAIEKGVCTDDIFERSEELQKEKEAIEVEIAKRNELTDISFSDDDVMKTLDDCKKLLKCPTYPTNRAFIRWVIKEIVIKRDEIFITLNTGLSVNDELNTTIKASRDEIYDYGRSLKNVG